MKKIIAIIALLFFIGCDDRINGKVPVELTYQNSDVDTVIFDRMYVEFGTVVTVSKYGCVQATALQNICGVRSAKVLKK